MKTSRLAATTTFTSCLLLAAWLAAAGLYYEAVTSQQMEDAKGPDTMTVKAWVDGDVFSWPSDYTETELLPDMESAQAADQPGDDGSGKRKKRGLKVLFGGRLGVSTSGRPMRHQVADGFGREAR